MLWSVLPLVVVCSSFGPPSEESSAREVYQQAQRAEVADTNYGLAADLYEIAYDLEPSPQALRGATRMRHAAREPARSATLALELSAAYAADDKSRRLASKVLEEAETALVRVHARCDQPCVLRVDGVALRGAAGTSHEFFAVPGPVVVTATFANGLDARQELAEAARAEVDVNFDRPTPRPVPAPAVRTLEGTDGRSLSPTTDSRRALLHPSVFAVGVVASVVSGGVLIWSGADVLRRNKAYEAEPTKVGFDTGRDAELRTNVLIATTAALATVTVVVAIVTDWSRKRERAPRASARRLRWGAGVEARF